MINEESVLKIFGIKEKEMELSISISHKNEKDKNKLPNK